MLSECKLGQVAADPTICRYLSQSGCVDIEDVDDAADHRVTLTAYSEMGFSEQEVRLLYKAAAGVLHLGNIVFCSHSLNSEESDISPDSAPWLRNAAELLGVDPTRLLQVPADFMPVKAFFIYTRTCTPYMNRRCCSRR